MPAFWQSLARDLHAPIRSFNAAKDVRNRAMLAGPASHHPALCSDGDPLERVAKQQTHVNPNFLARRSAGPVNVLTKCWLYAGQHEINASITLGQV